RTEPTSPLMIVVMYAPPIGSCFTRVTLAALSMASAASIWATKPRVSTSPMASFMGSSVNGGDEFVEVFCAAEVAEAGLSHGRARTGLLAVFGINSRRILASGGQSRVLRADAE